MHLSHRTIHMVWEDERRKLQPPVGESEKIKLWAGKSSTLLIVAIQLHSCFLVDMHITMLAQLFASVRLEGDGWSTSSSSCVCLSTREQRKKRMLEPIACPRRHRLPSKPQSAVVRSFLFPPSSPVLWKIYRTQKRDSFQALPSALLWRNRIQFFTDSRLTMFFFINFLSFAPLLSYAKCSYNCSKFCLSRPGGTVWGGELKKAGTESVNRCLQVYPKW